MIKYALLLWIENCILTWNDSDPTSTMFSKVSATDSMFSCSNVVALLVASAVAMATSSTLYSTTKIYKFGTNNENDIIQCWKPQFLCIPIPTTLAHTPHTHTTTFNNVPIVSASKKCWFYWKISQLSNITDLHAKRAKEIELDAEMFLKKSQTCCVVYISGMHWVMVKAVSKWIKQLRFLIDLL